jgi:hypothetical protein
VAFRGGVAWDTASKVCMRLHYHSTTTQRSAPGPPVPSYDQISPVDATDPCLSEISFLVFGENTSVCAASWLATYLSS